MNNANEQFRAAWRSPSNIALVKYWGKKENQIPANPSVSFTLDNAVTETSAILTPAADQKGIVLDFRFEGKENPAFASKIEGFLEKAATGFPWLKTHKLRIDSSNTFPHSSGIASSASAYSALALCLCSLNEIVTGESDSDFFRHASHWARIGSGSACRSVYGGTNLWGESEFFPGSSDEYAVNIDHQVHPVFSDFTDTILIIEKGSKTVSSTRGHALLKEHPFAATRYELARKNTGRILEILREGDLDSFIYLVEYEALILHALMMSSPEPFILMKPATLSVLEKIRDFRNQTGLHLLFTLDAGANVHLLAPAAENRQVQDFVQNELLGYCMDASYFCNSVGKGPVRL